MNLTRYLAFVLIMAGFILSPAPALAVENTLETAWWYGGNPQTGNKYVKDAGKIVRTLGSTQVANHAEIWIKSPGAGVFSLDNMSMMVSADPVIANRFNYNGQSMVLYNPTLGTYYTKTRGWYTPMGGTETGCWSDQRSVTNAPI